MVSEEKAEEEASSTPRLQLFTVPTTMESPVRSGTVTPPLQTSAAVPFRWEEEPGKPRPCTALIALPTTTKCLELPPRLQLLESSSSKMTRTPSPTTVLDGPYPPPLLQSSASSSFRFKRDRKQGSFAYYSSPERGQLGAMVLAAGESKSKSKKPPEERKGKKRLFGSSWGRKSTRRLDEQSGRREDGGGSLVFSYSMDIADFGPDEVGRSASARMMMMTTTTKKKKKKTSRITRKTRTHLSHSQPPTNSSRIWVSSFSSATSP